MKPVAAVAALLLQIECTDEAFRKSCADRGGKVSIIRRDRNVVPHGHADYVDEVCPAS